MLQLPIHRGVRFLLVRPHYPENVGASCRALKTMGFSDIGLVRPGRLAMPDHPMARKMAVKSLDVLENAELYDNLDEASVGFDVVVGTTARRGISGVLAPHLLAPHITKATGDGRRACIVFGNEKSGLSTSELQLCDRFLRVPLAADQPSLNLAQAVQIVSYQLFQCALDQREAQKDTALGQTQKDV